MIFIFIVFICNRTAAAFIEVKVRTWLSIPFSAPRSSQHPDLHLFHFCLQVLLILTAALTWSQSLSCCDHFPPAVHWKVAFWPTLTSTFCRRRKWGALPETHRVKMILKWYWDGEEKRIQADRVYPSQLAKPGQIIESDSFFFPVIPVFALRLRLGYWLDGGTDSWSDDGWLCPGIEAKTCNWLISFLCICRQR